MLLPLAAAALVVLSAATASHTPTPSSVTVVGSLQSEASCPGDWDPACAATHLTYDAGDDVWQATFPLPAGSYEYKAALDDSWTENYGLHAVQDGPNIPLSLPSAGSETLQYAVTDGSTFTDLQTRDMTYAVEAVPDSGGMA